MEELQLDYTELQQTVEELLPQGTSISIASLFEELMTGGGIKEFFSTLVKWLASYVTIPTTQGIHLVALLLFSALFTNLTRAFQRNGASQMGCLCTYLLLTLYIASGFQSSLTMAKEGITNLCRFTTVLLPTYCVSIAFVTGSLTATGYYQGTAVLITVLEYVTEYVLLPMSRIYLLIAVASCMQREPIFTKLLQMIATVFSWIRKSMLGVVLAFGAVQGILCPAIDSVKRNTLVQTASAIPGVGNLLGGVWETVMGAGIVLKNALGIGGVCILFAIGMLPLSNLFLQYMVYRVVAAVTEPVIQEQTGELLNHVGTAQKFLLQTVALGMLLFLLLLVIMTRITV